MAARKSVVSTSGRERVVSSVTYATGSPALTATSIASALRLAMSATSHCSTNCRIGLEPMNAQTSMRRPVRWLISTIGAMSATTVRPAQPTWIASLHDATSFERVSTSSNARLLLPGRPMSAYSIPNSSIRCRMRSLSSIDGSSTLGFCSPSRRVSSTSANFWGTRRPFRLSSFQSKIKSPARSPSVVTAAMIAV